MSEPRYERIIRFPVGLRTLIDEYAAARGLSFNRAVTELLETHPQLLAVYERLVQK